MYNNSAIILLTTSALKLGIEGFGISADRATLLLAFYHCCYEACVKLWLDPRHKVTPRPIPAELLVSSFEIRVDHK